MNRKQWFVLALIFFILFISLYKTATIYDKWQGEFYNLALNSTDSVSDAFASSSRSFMINDNIYRMGSQFALALFLGCLICGFLESKKKV